MAIAKKRAEVTINRTASDVWARIGDFADLSWFPGMKVELCDSENRIRSVTQDAWGFCIRQRLIEHDDTRRTCSYELPEPLDLEAVAGPGKIVHVLNGHLTVTPKGESQSDVTWDLETEDFLIGGSHAQHQNVLDTLKVEMEG
ncbi:Polyketide cyclase / dehydrase and lipid transport [Novosphingobium sp. CF614]|uniref:SRPBCC family protein n=1 Tax=Novosphingobium sp. CF614 TaxID=1884364 RepID=UPI0008E13316|nr:SRPBCC family protein [Novosphingobium sp. CF614]SFG47079.1 Polyketide cyclase / dehydrase and lipid transport [Novosphingobium sp. CF614]